MSDERENVYFMQLTVTELGTRDGNDILVCLEQFLGSKHKAIVWCLDKRPSTRLLLFLIFYYFDFKVIKTLVYYFK